MGVATAATLFSALKFLFDSLHQAGCHIRSLFRRTPCKSIARFCDALSGTIHFREDSPTGSPSSWMRATGKGEVNAPPLRKNLG